MSKIKAKINKISSLLIALCLSATSIMSFNVMSYADIAGTTYTGTEDASGYTEGDTIDLLAGVKASCNGVALSVKVVNVNAEGDDGLRLSTDSSVLYQAKYGAIYTVTYNAIDTEGIRYGTATKKFFIDIAPVGEDEPEIKVDDRDYTFELTGVEDANALINSDFDMLFGIDSIVYDGQMIAAEPEIQDCYEPVVISVVLNGHEVETNGEVLHTSEISGKKYTIKYGIKNLTTNKIVSSFERERLVTTQAISEVKEKLSSDDEYITLFKLTAKSDGTSPFDTADGDGFDSSAYNDVIRTFDNITYTLTLSSANKTAGVYYKEGYIGYKFYIPYNPEIAFDTSAMSWMVSDTGTKYDYKTGVETADGQQYTYLIAYRHLVANSNQTTVFPIYNLTTPVVVSVKNAAKNTVITPKFYAWIDYNESNEVKEATNKVGVNFATTVTAAPKYNLKLVKTESYADYASTGVGKNFNFSTGNSNALNSTAGTQNGLLVGYGLVFELLNDGDANKGLKGIQLPSENSTIQFDVDFTNKYTYNNDSDNITKDLTTTATPLIWSYDSTGNTNNATQTDGRKVVDSALTKNTLSYIPDIPYNNGADIKSCFNGGSYVITQSGATAKVKINGLKIDYNSFPSQDAAGLKNKYYNDSLYGTGISSTTEGILSAGELWVFEPLFEGSDQINKKYTGTLSSNKNIGTLSLNAKLYNLSINNQPVIENRTDDNEVLNSFSLMGTGDWNNYVQYTYNSTPSLDTTGGTAFLHTGGDYSQIGNTIGILYGGVGLSEAGEKQDYNGLYGADILVKFDGNAFDIDSITRITSDYTDKYNYKYYYATKADGTNWIDYAEMSTTNIDGLVYYDSLNAIPAGYKCVGVVTENRIKDYTDYPIGDYIYLRDWLKLKINTNALQGQVYPAVVTSNVYKYKINTIDYSVNPAPSITTQQDNAWVWTNNTSSYNSSVFHNFRASSYTPAIWENGICVDDGSSGTSSGDSVYIVNAVPIIEKHILQTENNVEKKTFNLDENQSDVYISLTPSFNIDNDIELNGIYTDLVITDTIPAGTTISDIVNRATFIQSKSGNVTSYALNGTAIDASKISYTPNVDGSQTVRIEYNNIPVNNELLKNTSARLSDYTICYKLEIDKELAKNNQQYEGMATVFDKSNVGKVSKSTIGFSVIKTIGCSISKTTPNVYSEVNENAEFDLSWTNVSGYLTDSLIMMDTMPFNNDENGTYIKTGTHTINALQLIIPEGMSASDYKFYYNSNEDAQGAVAYEFNTKEDLINAGYVEATINTDGLVSDVIDKTVYSWAVVGKLPANKELKAHIAIAPTSVSGGDIYGNGISISNGGYSKASTIYIARGISGQVWYDRNQDGIKQNSESTISGANVVLQKLNSSNTWENAVDLNGNACSVETATNGRYSFNNLADGQYRIVFKNGSTDISVYDITLRNVAGSTEYNNNDGLTSTEAERSADIHAVIAQDFYNNDIVLPAKDDMTSYSYYKKFLDLGLTLEQGTYKTVQDESGDYIDGCIVQPGDVITYSIEFTDKFQDNITIIDPLPEYVDFYNSAEENVHVIYDVTDVSDYNSFAELKGFAKLPENTSLSTPVVVINVDKTDYSVDGMVSFDVQIDEHVPEAEIIRNKARTMFGTHGVYTNVTTNYADTYPTKDVFKKDDTAGATSIDCETVENGDYIRYRIYYMNPYETDCDIEIADYLDEALTYYSSNNNGVYNATNHAVTWNITAKARTQQSVDVVVLIKDTTPTGYEIKNSAYTQLEGENVHVTNEVMNPVHNKNNTDPIKAVLDDNGKDINKQTRDVNTNLNYTITVSNNNIRANKCTIVDEVPTGLEIVSVSTEETSNIEGNKVTFSNVTIPAGGTKTLKIKAKILETSVGYKFDNKAVVTYSDGTEKTTNIVTNNTVAPISKQVVDTSNNDINGKLVTNDFQFAYKINYAKPATGTTVKITDTLPEGITFVSATDNGTCSGQTVTWNITSNYAGFVTVNVKVNKDVADKVFKNTAKVEYSTGWSGTTNEVINYIVGAPTKTVKCNGQDVNGKAVDNNSQLVYEITVKNPSKTAISYKITDTVPANTSFISASDNGTLDGSSVTWNISVGAESTKTVTLTVLATNEGSSQITVTNKATATIDNTSKDTNTVTTTILAPGQVLEKDGTITNGVSTDSAKTGDTTPIWLYILLGASGLSIIVLVVILNKKRKDK